MTTAAAYYIAAFIHYNIYYTAIITDIITAIIAHITVINNYSTIIHGGENKIEGRRWGERESMKRGRGVEGKDRGESKRKRQLNRVL